MFCSKTKSGVFGKLEVETIVKVTEHKRGVQEKFLVKQVIPTNRSGGVSPVYTEQDCRNQTRLGQNIRLANKLVFVGKLVVQLQVQDRKEVEGAFSWLRSLPAKGRKTSAYERRPAIMKDEVSFLIGPSKVKRLEIVPIPPVAPYFFLVAIFHFDVE